MDIKITACMIVKDTANTIIKAIQSVRAHVDHVVVLDTGSTDRTVQLAREQGANVHNSAWVNDFSQARNLSLQYAMDSQWVLVIDADEQFEWEENMSLKEWVSTINPERSVIAFKCLHVDTETGSLLSETHAERLFSPAFFCYTGIIHESLVSIQETDKEIILCSTGVYRHVGYSSEYHLQKSERNTTLLKKAIEVNPTSGLYYRYLSNETYNKGDYSETITLTNIALERLSVKENYSRAQAYYYKIMACLQMKDEMEAEATARICVEEIPFYADPYAIIAEIYFSNARWAEALNWYYLWEQQLKQAAQKPILPNHCISLQGILSEHKNIAAERVRPANSSTKKGITDMKAAILIMNPHLEMDWEGLLAHFVTKLEGIPYELGIWVNNKYEEMLPAKSWVKKNKIHIIEAATLAQAGEKILAATQFEVVWYWDANERVASVLSTESLMEAGSTSAEMIIRRSSDRLCYQQKERRLWSIETFMLSKNPNLLEAAATSNRTKRKQNIITVDTSIKMIKPLIISKEKQQAYQETFQHASPLEQLLVAFGCLDYEAVLEIEEPDGNAPEWAAFCFYRVMASYNLNQMEQASEWIYEAMESDIPEKNQLDFIYLYGKLAQNVDIVDMKNEAIELLESVMKKHPIIETIHVTTTESEWLELVAELKWQIGDQSEAIQSWRYSLESSDYSNITCAYRLAEAVYQLNSKAGLEKVARVIMDIFTLDSPKAQAFLHPIFSYLNMTEWALLFQRSVLEPPKLVASKDKQNSLVSIVLPVYNDTDYLFDSILSVLSQSYLNLELIIVDDGLEIMSKRSSASFNTTTG